MKNNALIVILVVLVGVLSGLALLIGFNNVLQVALGPVSSQLNQIHANNNLLAQRLETIENQLKGLGSAQPALVPPQPPAEDFSKVYTIDAGASPIEGKKDAPITIVQFTDLQCPFCNRFYPPIKEVLKAYPEKVRFIVKNYPLAFHPNARPAAKLALAAHEQGKYFEMTELLLQNGADVSETKIKEYATALNLNYDRLMKDAKDKDAQYDKLIADDMSLAEKVDVRGTPTFYINGKKTMARDFNGYKTEIDKILSGK